MVTSSGKSNTNYTPMGAGYSIPASTISGGEGAGVAPSPSIRTWRNDPSGSGGYVKPDDYTSTTGSVVTNGVEISRVEQEMIQKYSSNPKQPPTSQQLRDYSRAKTFYSGRELSPEKAKQLGIETPQSVLLNAQESEFVRAPYKSKAELYERQISLKDNIPVTQVRYRDEKGVDRIATKEETSYFNSQPSRLEVINKPGWNLKSLDPFQRLSYEKQIAKQSLSENSFFGRAASTAAGVVSGSVLFPLESSLFAIRHPVQSAKSTFSLFTKPGRERLSGNIAGEFQSRPSYALGFGMGAALIPTPKVINPVGAAAGKVTPKVQGLLRTLGRTELPVERVIEPNVLSGKNRFPLAGSSGKATQELHFNLFQEQKYSPPITKLSGYSGKGELVYPESYMNLPFNVKPGGYHATPAKFWKKEFTTTPGSSEFPGVYVSGKGISPHFLKINKYGNAKPDLVDWFYNYPFETSKPAVAYITPGKIIKGKSSKIGQAFVPGVKPEVEAISPPGGKFNLIGKDFYFKYGGQRVLLDQFKYSLDAGVNKQSIPQRELSSSYSYNPAKTIRLSSSLFGLSNKESKINPSYSNYQISSLKPSYFKSASKTAYSPPLSMRSSSLSPSSPASAPRTSISKSYSPSYSKVNSIISLIKSYKKSPASYTSSYKNKLSSYSPSPSRGYNPPYPPSKKSYSSSKLKSLLNAKNSYNIFVKRFGKDVSIGSAASKTEAAQKLLSTLKGSLRASGYVSSGGSRVNLAGLYGSEFGPSKRDMLRVVQKARFRLSTGGEKLEIKQARRNTKLKLFGRTKI